MTEENVRVARVTGGAGLVPNGMANEFELARASSHLPASVSARRYIRTRGRGTALVNRPPNLIHPRR